MEQLAAVAVVVALILGAVFFLLNGKPKSFLDKTRQKLKLGKIVKVRRIPPLPFGARAPASLWRLSDLCAPGAPLCRSPTT